MIIFTSICANYLHKARTLAESVKQNMPYAKFFVCMTEREKTEAMEFHAFDEVVLSKDMWEGNFNRFIYKHAIVEASTAVKARFFQYLMNRFPEEEEFIYLDPDCYVYSDFTELREALKRKPIVLCPHLLQPGNIDMELSSTAHGVYNLGFLAVNHSKEAVELINWWTERLYLFCYDDIQRGIFTDQKWMDLAPCFFDVEVFKHRGYDFAPWSLLDCGMTKENGKFLVKGDEIRFIHFSGYGATAQKCMNDWLPEGEHPFRELYEQYSIQHEKNNEDGVSKTPWTYNSYYSGEKIDDSIRKKYRKDYDLMFALEDPFELSNKMISVMIKDRKSDRKGLKTYLQMSKNTLEQEGFSSFIRKVKKKIRGSF